MRRSRSPPAASALSPAVPIPAHSRHIPGTIPAPRRRAGTLAVVKLMPWLHARPNSLPGPTARACTWARIRTTLHLGHCTTFHLGLDSCSPASRPSWCPIFPTRPMRNRWNLICTRWVDLLQIVRQIGKVWPRNATNRPCWCESNLGLRVVAAGNSDGRRAQARCAPFSHGRRSGSRDRAASRGAETSRR